MSALKRLWLLAALLLMTSCQTTNTGATRVVDTSCEAFGPVTYSRADTARTRLQIRRHNAAWDALCNS